MKYRYKLNFKKSIDIENSDDQDIGYIISGTMKNLKLNGAIFLTNAKFSHPATAKKYLCLTYTPRFRYIVYEDELPENLEPNFIKSDNNRIISKRTSPAFGKVGGVGEWIILTKCIPNNNGAKEIQLLVDHHYKEGGEPERWYIGSWNRELLASISSGFTGHIIKGKDLQMALSEEQLIEETFRIDENVPGFWPGKEERTLLTIKPEGLVAYASFRKLEYPGRKFQGIAYLSVSCVYQVISNTVYIKLYGALWEDFFIDGNNKSCDGIYEDLKDILNFNSTSCWAHNKYEIIDQFESGAKTLNACGIRSCSYIIEMEEFSFSSNLSDQNNKKKIRKTISQLVRSMKEYLLKAYRGYRCFPSEILCNSWCCNKKRVVILPHLSDYLVL